MPETPAFSEARAAAARGWPVVQVYGINPDLTCRCGGLKSCRGGRNAGKHPIVRRWQQHATSDVEALGRAEREHPGSNYGGAPGGAFIVVDVDPRGGGDLELAELERTLGPRPPTVRVSTGGGGWHEYYLVPPGRVVRNGKLRGCTGVDIKAAGGQVILPGSLHASGRRYEWAPGASPDDVAIAELPEEWLDLLPRDDAAGDAARHRRRRPGGAGPGDAPAARPTGRDESRSGHAFRSAKAAHARGIDREVWIAMLADESNDTPEARWYRDQRGDQRQIDRVWRRSGGTLTQEERQGEALAQIEQLRAAVLVATIHPTLRKVVLAALALMESESTRRLGVGGRDVAALAQMSQPTAARRLAEAARDGWLQILDLARGPNATVYGLPPSPYISDSLSCPVSRALRVRADSDSQMYIGLHAVGAESFHRQFAGMRGLGPSFERVADVVEQHAAGVRQATIAKATGLDRRTVVAALAQGAGDEPVGGQVVADRSGARLVTRRGKDGRALRVWVGIKRRIEGTRRLPFPLFEQTAAGAWRWRTDELRERLGLGADVDAHDVHVEAFVEIERWLGLDHAAERKADRHEREREEWRGWCAMRQSEREAEERASAAALLMEPHERYVADEPDWLPEYDGADSASWGARSGEIGPGSEPEAKRPERPAIEPAKSQTAAPPHEDSRREGVRAGAPAKVEVGAALARPESDAHEPEAAVPFTTLSGRPGGLAARSPGASENSDLLRRALARLGIERIEVPDDWLDEDDGEGFDEDGEEWRAA